MEQLISTDASKCTSCHKCVDVCPVRVIKMNDDGVAQSTTDAFELCLNCGYCVDICVFDALKHKVRTRSPNPRSALMRYQAFKKYEHLLTSTRK